MRVSRTHQTYAAIISTIFCQFIAAGVLADEGPTQAVGYFVDCASGNDGASGKSYATAWRSLEKVSQSVKTVGADVWIKAGTRCANQVLQVDWSGTASDPVVVGSYYIRGTDAYEGYAGSTRAEISGTYEPQCRRWPSKCAWNTASSGEDRTGSNAIPASRYSGLVVVSAQKYVTIQDLSVTNSAGIGILFDGKAATNICTSAVGSVCEFHWMAKNNTISHTASTPLMFLEGRYLVARGNQTEFGNLSWPDSQPYATRWGPAIHIGRCQPCNALIEDNDVRDDWGEGIGPYHGSVILIRGNRIANVRRASIYTSGDRVVVEQNIISGGAVTPEPGLGDPGRTGEGGPAFYSLSFHREPSSTAGGDFNSAEATKQLFRNNLIANFETCLHVGISPSETNFSLGGKYVGNTCVGAKGKSGFQHSGDAGLTAAEGVEVADNILAVVSGVTGCSAVTDPRTKMHHNYWTGTPSDADCRNPGTGDLYGTFAALDLGGHDFSSSTGRDFPTSDWFRTPSASAVSNKGMPLMSTYLAEADWQWILDQRVWKPTCQSAQVSSADFIKVLSTDYCGARRSSTTPTIGAFEGSDGRARYELMVE